MPKKQKKLPKLVLHVHDQVRRQLLTFGKLEHSMYLRRIDGVLEEKPLNIQSTKDRQVLAGFLASEILNGTVQEFCAVLVMTRRDDKHEDIVLGQALHVFYERLGLRLDFMVPIHTKPELGMSKWTPSEETRYEPNFEAFHEEVEDGRFQTLFGQAAKFAQEELAKET